MPKVGLLYDTKFLEHLPTDYHPEQPSRLTAMMDGLHRRGLDKELVRVAPEPAGRDLLEKVHDPEYLDRLQRVVPGSSGYLDADTYYSPGTWDAALLAAGGAAKLARMAVAGDLDTALALVRPPGHHATRKRAMGFCLVNNVAVAARAALDSGARKVAIVDWDVHHGNGTQEIFYRSDEVLYSSFHLYPHYPGTGHHHEIGLNQGEGTTVNFPMPFGSGRAEYAAGFHRVLLPVLEEFRPDLLLVSSGFDSHRRDPLGGIRLDTEDFRAMTLLLRDLAARVGAKGPVVLLEGGYNLDVLGDCAVALAESLLQEDTPDLWSDAPEPMDRVDLLLRELAGILRRARWSL